MSVLQRDARADHSRVGRVCWGLCTTWAPAPALYLPAGRKACPWHCSNLQLQSSKPVHWSPWCRSPIPVCSLAVLAPAIRKAKRIPPHAAQTHHPQDTLHPTRLSAPSLPGGTRASRGKWKWLLIPPSVAIALQGPAPQQWREPTPACEPAAPAWPREHGPLYFHCKLEINHSRKFLCCEHRGYYYFTALRGVLGT